MRIAVFIGLVLISSLFHQISPVVFSSTSTTPNVDFHIYGDTSVSVSYGENVVLVSRNESMYIPAGSVVGLQVDSVNENPCIEINGMKSQGSVTFVVNGSEIYNVTIVMEPVTVFIKVIYQGNGYVSIMFQNGTTRRVNNGTPIYLPKLSVVRLDAHPSNGYEANWSNGLSTDQVWCFIYQNQTLFLSFHRDPSSHSLIGGSNLILNSALGLLLLGLYLLQRHEKKKEGEF
ncbi:hypothetical protein [Sulfuracidifex tepidarius]|uniref:Uncharacterized protein n=1 Tax=Sulfuracidifex tepidarius TaxID=1294262 RepID=A0A510DZ50_9CREN|nr:hypothetical protein [Sulfuracidifex tepidarius]BBG25514.1 hypothetical protein IC007_0019 [Sulfuracidifex tepidarius]